MKSYLTADQPAREIAHRSRTRWRSTAVAVDAVALDAVALDAVALDAVALDAVALDRGRAPPQGGATIARQLEDIMEARRG